MVEATRDAWTPQVLDDGGDVDGRRSNITPFLLTRAGFTGIQRFSWVWTGDNTSTYMHMAQSIPTLLNLIVSGVPFVGADIGACRGSYLFSSCVDADD